LHCNKKKQLLLNYPVDQKTLYNIARRFIRYNLPLERVGIITPKSQICSLKVHFRSIYFKIQLQPKPFLILSVIIEIIKYFKRFYFWES